MLIIEGPDGVGKTTFAKKLLKLLEQDGYIYSHFTRLPVGFDYYWGYVERMSGKIVQDRFHMSEIAYAQARGESPKLDGEGYRLIDANLRLLGGYMVLIRADESLVSSRWDSSQMYDLEKTVKAARIFNDISRSRHALGIDIDYTINLSLDKPYATDTDVDKVITEYRARRRRVAELLDRRPGAL